jgi:hypothetical protein
MKIGAYPAKGFQPQDIEMGCFETKSGSFVSYSRSGEKQLLEGSKQGSKVAVAAPKPKKIVQSRRGY